MPLTLEEYRRRFPDRPDPIPLAYQGKWIAMTPDRRKILASGSNPTEVRKCAECDGYPNAVVHYVMPYPYVGFGLHR